ncbi:MAG: peptide chain release factor N(5)-glutamine methyltransferase [Hyphomicrobiales bacterium]|nr:MAG: peptide chain release factor N(5)-glutamine methyltransferase [Hyphomicrobiales bacterium]
MRGDLASSPAASQAPSRGEAVARVVACLVDSGVEPAQARDDARLLLRAAAGLTRLELAMAPDAPLTEEQALRLSAFAARRAAREPVSRILGARGFWTLDLAVMPNVLDPRADTETLVETTLALVGDRNAPLSIVDLGSGSGAILCALLSELPLARGLAVDLSPDACAATRENLRRCGLSGRAQVVRGRWGASLKGPFDVVVSNPPYVRADELLALDPEVSLHDPALALDGGADGLVCYRDIIADLGRLLAPGGLAAFEVGFDQAASVAALLGAHGFIVERIARDAAGRDRVVAARPVRPRS